jgi:hypothetical protein
MRYFSVLVGSALLLAPLPALALDVSSPYVNEGIIKIDSKNRWDKDGDSTRDDARRHEMKATYGITRWWAVEVGGELGYTPGEDHSLNTVLVENLFQLTTRGAYWLDAGIKLGYERALTSGEPDELGARLLLAKNVGRTYYLTNLNFKQETGTHSNANPTGELRTLVRYNYEKHLNPGIEYYAAMNELTDMGSYDEQKHRIGPALAGKLADGLAYDAGVIFGISDASEDTVLRLNLKYEFSL